MPIKINQRDCRIFRFLAVHCFATVRVLHRRFFSDATDEAAKSWIQRMINAGYIASQPLDSNGHVYYHLTKKAITYVERTLTAPISAVTKRIIRSKRKPLKGDAKARYFAFHEYCTDPELARLRPSCSGVMAGLWERVPAEAFSVLEPFRPIDEPETFRDIVHESECHEPPQPLDPLHKFLFYHDGTTIGLFELDTGKWDFVHQRIPKRVAEVRGRKSINSFFDENRARLTIATATESRAKRLRTLINRFRSKTPFSAWEVVWIPSLAAVLPTNDRRVRHLHNSTDNHKATEDTNEKKETGQTNPGQESGCG